MNSRTQWLVRPRHGHRSVGGSRGIGCLHKQEVPDSVTRYGGADSAFSLKPHEIKATVAAARTVEKALGKVNYAVSGREEANQVFRHSLFMAQDIKGW